MTAIAIVYTKAGFVIAADGRARLSVDPTIGTDQEQKIFQGTIGAADIAWTLAGNVFNKDKTFSLIDGVKQCIQAANANGQSSCGPWLDAFAASLRSFVLEARRKDLIAPFAENTDHPNPAERSTLATVFMAGYFCNGKPSSVRIFVAHQNGELVDPLPMVLIAASPNEKHNIYYGSQDIGHRWFGVNPDKRFVKYFHPSGPTLNDALTHAKGYIEACCDPLALEVDPIICKNIGGHIHAVAVTREGGFSWLIEPLENAIS